MVYGFDCDIDVKVWPVQMVSVGQLDIQQITNRGIAEPRKLVKSYKPFFVPNEEPKPVL